LYCVRIIIFLQLVHILLDHVEKQTIARKKATIKKYRSSQTRPDTQVITADSSAS